MIFILKVFFHNFIDFIQKPMDMATLILTIFFIYIITHVTYYHHCLYAIKAAKGMATSQICTKNPAVSSVTPPKDFHAM